jgi:hypothetical protein
VSLRQGANRIAVVQDLGLSVRGARTENVFAGISLDLKPLRSMQAAPGFGLRVRLRLQPALLQHLAKKGWRGGSLAAACMAYGLGNDNVKFVLAADVAVPPKAAGSGQTAPAFAGSIGPGRPEHVFCYWGSPQAVERFY